MPIQNAGTLLENLVLTETISVLGKQVGGDKCLAVATAFAMPALSAWAPHSQCVGISTDALERIANNRHDHDFLRVMARCLSYRSDGGPSGALLAGLLATLKGLRLRVWANDIPDGHYGNAIPSLKALPDLVSEILPELEPRIVVNVCDHPYPKSIRDLSRTMSIWEDVGAIVGFLDPMRYVTHSRRGPYTRKADHLQWLDALKLQPTFAAVHFTGNSDSRSLVAELDQLRDDLVHANVSGWREFKRQHYVVSVGCSDDAVLTRVEDQVLSSWDAWCAEVPEIRDRSLHVRRSNRTNGAFVLVSGALVSPQTADGRSMTEAEVHFHPSPTEASFEVVVSRPVSLLLAGGIVNPFGPTLTVVIASGELSAGSRIPLIHMMLNPFAQSCEEVGEVVLGTAWEPSRLIPALFNLPFGSCPTLLIPNPDLSPEEALDLHAAFLQYFDDGQRVLRMVRKFLGNPWDRVTNEMSEPAGGLEDHLLDAPEATELSRLLLSDKHARPELAAFLYAWEGSINFQRKMNNETLVNDAFSRDDVVNILRWLAQGL